MYMCSDFLTSSDLIRSRINSVCHHLFPYMDVRSVASLFVM
jgi:hypothetical protein